MARFQRGVSLPPEMWVWLDDHYKGRYKRMNLAIEEAVYDYMIEHDADPKDLDSLKAYKKSGKDADYVGEVRWAVLDGDENLEKDLAKLENTTDMTDKEKARLGKRLKKRYARVKDRHLKRIGVRKK